MYASNEANLSSELHDVVTKLQQSLREYVVSGRNKEVVDTTRFMALPQEVADDDDDDLGDQLNVETVKKVAWNR